MKKLMSALLALTAALCCALCMSACSDNDIIGSYEFFSITIESTDPNSGKIERFVGDMDLYGDKVLSKDYALCTVNEDGTFLMIGDGESMNGTWEKTGSVYKFVIIGDYETELTVSFNNGVLSLSQTEEYGDYTNTSTINLIKVKENAAD